jgi:two-component system, LytTR family, response regulator
MNAISTLIVDDEPLARRGLQLRLANYQDISVSGECRNGREALAAIAEHRPDLVFLDVQMPGMNGFDVLRRLAGNHMPAIIFVTAYDEFALKAFEANAIDYLLKPINDERLRDAIGRTRKALQDSAASNYCERLLSFVCELTGRDLSLEDALSEANSAGGNWPRRIAIKDGRDRSCVEVEDIDWIDAAGDYMCVHADEETYVLRGTMKQLEDLLNPGLFVRIHRSTIVNRERVKSLRPHRNGEYFLNLDCGHELKLSRNYKHQLKRFADNL